ncbi:MAG: serine hydrolase, partial [Fusicatenibacter sp.]|nr:serine hydrolase [Fusicatenibacter sp.]
HPDELVTILQEDLDLEEGSQMSGMKAGDTVTMDQLFHVLMIYSANDAAMAIARVVGGSTEQFVQMMNDKALALGMTGTHFENPHGLHDENHYTTAYDVYLMLNEAFKDPKFQATMGMASYTLTVTREDQNTVPIYLTSTDKYLTGEKSVSEGVTVLGGKTGTTSQAGACLAIASQNSYGEPFISVILNAKTKDALYSDMSLLLSKINE